MLPWQHNGFQTSPILKAFLATFGILFSYLQTMPDMHYPALLLSLILAKCIQSAILNPFFQMSIHLMQKWLPLNYSFVRIQNSLTNLVRDNKFFTIFVSKTRLVRLI